MNKLSECIEQWRGELLDTSKRNPLISLKLGTRGAIELQRPATQTIWRRLIIEEGAVEFPLPPPQDDTDDSSPTAHGESSEPSSALTPVAPTGDGTRAASGSRKSLVDREPSPNEVVTTAGKSLQPRLKRLAEVAKTSLSEQGVPTLFVAFGLLKWFEAPASQEEILAPLILFPVALEREDVTSPWELSLQENEAVLNHSLAHLLKAQFAVSLPEFPSEDDEIDDWREAYFEAVQEAVKKQPRWQVEDRCGFGVFSFQKIAMWQDLGENQDRIAEHPLCGMMGGGSAFDFSLPTNTVSAADLDDKVAPTQTFQILEADSSQQEAIEVVKAGGSLIIDGPPGTGKSQTIANLIAEFLAVGKTVLFVSEKAAALEVVKRRLDGEGLGDFCLELHSHKANKTEVVKQLGHALELHHAPSASSGEELRRLDETRRRLNGYVRALHQRRSPLEKSAFEVNAQLAALGDQQPSQCPVSDAATVDEALLRRRTAILDGLRSFKSVLASPDSHPWRGVRRWGRSLTLVEEVRQKLHQVSTGLPVIQQVIEALNDLGWRSRVPSISEWLLQIHRAVDAAGYPLVPLAWFAGDVRDTASAYVQIDEATRSFRTARAGLADYSIEKVLQASPATFELLKRLRVSSEQTNQLSQLKSVREICKALEKNFSRLSNLVRQLAATQKCFEDLCTGLRLPIRAVPVREWERYSLLRELLDERARPCREWFEPAARKELQHDADHCRELRRRADEIHDELVKRFSSKAFTDAGRAIAEDAVKYTSFWSRWFPAWKRVRAEAATLYRGEAPEPATLLVELGKLREYHRLLDEAKRFAQQHSAQIALDELGLPHWERTVAPLAIVDSLGPVWTRFPELKAAVASAQIDRAVAVAALDAFKQSENAFRAAVADMRGSFRISEGFQASPAKGELSASQLTEDLNKSRQDWEGVFQAGATLKSFLLDERDAAVERLSAHLNDFELLRASAAKIKALAGSLALPEPDRSTVYDRDWSADRKTAEWLLRFLHEHANNPPQPLLDAARRPDARARLADLASRVAGIQKAGFFDAWTWLVELFGDEPTSMGVTLPSASLEALTEWVGSRTQDAAQILEWTGLNELRRQADEAGVGQVIQEVLAGQVGVEQASSVYLAKFYKSWLDHVQENVAELQGFAAETPDALVDQFRGLDRKAIKSASGRIRAILLSNPTRPRMFANAPDASDLGVLMREVNKKQRHMPLRKLFERTATLLPRLKPCLMMSPLAVSTYLSAAEFQFDLVVIDEASQVLPQDAVPALYRGKQIVVAGDKHQLPPTSFFSRAALPDDDEDEADDDIRDFESILDVCISLGVARRRLRWHYRSRREQLIAFSNRHIYDNDLVTFPSVDDGGDPPAIRFEHVAEGRWIAGKGKAFNPIEARRTAELIVEHFRASPDQSLGVIAFSMRQQFAISDELEKLRRQDPSLEGFFSSDRDEPFFIKNLENVQGDERDAIFLSVGYGPDEQGRVALRFLTRQGDERRLNVAVTRARAAMTVISSMKAQDIDPARVTSRGPKLLRDYLDFAQRGVAAFASAISTADQHDADSPFEAAVGQALVDRGLKIHRQVGCSSYRIDLAVVDPDAPGKYLLGVECDGAAYHSSKTARDRDRIRQQILEGLGWSIHRIWSTDWIRNPSAQVERVLAAVEKAAQRAKEASQAPTLQPSAKPTDESHKRDEPTALRRAAAIAQVKPAGPAYKSIDDVPERDIEKRILHLLAMCGTTEPGDLIRSVSQDLGFQRTGAKIKARVERTLEALVAVGKIHRVEGGVRSN